MFEVSVQELAGQPVKKNKHLHQDAYIILYRNVS